MPIQLKASDVKQRYTNRTNAQIDRLVMEELGAVRKLFEHTLRAVETHVDAHFEEQRAAGAPPYVEARTSYAGRNAYEAVVRVPIDEALSAPLADGKVEARLRNKVVDLLKANGFEAYCGVADGTLSITLWDPAYRPTLNEEHLVDATVDARLKAPRDH